MYCSVPCYKSKLHENCSESFYRECVIKELENNKLDNNLEEMSPEMKKMMSILKRFESIDSNHSSISDFDISDIEDNTINADSGPSIQELDDSEELHVLVNEKSEDEDFLDSDDEQEGTDLAKRLEGVNLDDADKVWDKLTEDERRAFDTFVLNGDIATVIPPYVPWWEMKFEKKIIEEVNDDKAIEKIAPEIIKDILPLDKLTSKHPAPVVSFNLINILAAYCYTVRFFDGDHHLASRQAASYFYRICGNVKTNLNINSSSDAFEQIYLFARQYGFQIQLHDIAAIKNDVTAIVNGPHLNEKSYIYVLAALSDLHRLFVEAKSKKYEEKGIIGVFSQKYLDYELNDFDLITKGKCSAVIKKIEYYLAYCSSCWCVLE